MAPLFCYHGQTMNTSAKSRADYMREWKRKNPDKIKANQRRYNASKGKARFRRWHLKARYGITLDRFNEMLAEQDHKCAICGEPEGIEYMWHGKLVQRSLCVDHSHTTGEVRGLLCASCNMAIGKFSDSPALLQAAATYLTKAANHGRITS